MNKRQFLKFSTEVFMATLLYPLAGFAKPKSKRRSNYFQAYGYGGYGSYGYGGYGSYGYGGYGSYGYGGYGSYGYGGYGSYGYGGYGSYGYGRKSKKGHKPSRVYDYMDDSIHINDDGQISH
jgi:hypothetical protein